jgi:hypothetical protein
MSHGQESTDTSAEEEEGNRSRLDLAVVKKFCCILFILMLIFVSIQGEFTKRYFST